MILVNYRKLGNWRGIMRLPKGRACRFIISFVDQDFFHHPKTIPLGRPLHDIKHLSEQWDIQSNHEMFPKPLKDLYYLETWDIIQKYYMLRCFMLAISLCCCPVEQGEWDQRGMCGWQKALNGMESVSTHSSTTGDAGDVQNRHRPRRKRRQLSKL